MRRRAPAGATAVIRQAEEGPDATCRS